MKKETLNKLKLPTLLTVVIALPLLALLMRGSTALQGITWGLNPTQLGPCSLELSVTKSYCAASKADVSVNFGVYDPDNAFANSHLFAFDHYFINWSDNTLSNLNANLAASSQKKRWPLLTVEPWPQQTGSHNSQNLLADVQAGYYDSQTDGICQAIKNYHQPVLLRWGQEMEYVSGRFPWATSNSQTYINAYQHFVTRCRATTDNIFYVWSPAGNKELANYWPGQSYVDYIGLSVFSFPQYEQDSYGQVRSFDQAFSEKYNRIKDYHRPVIIAEMGVLGSPDHQWFWMQDALRSTKNYPLLKSVVYFNAKDSPAAWEAKYPTPDWHISLDVFKPQP